MTADQRHYVRLTENNDWEGETWHFYIPLDGNEQAIANLRAKIDDQPSCATDEKPPYVLSPEGETLTESQVETLVRYGEETYLPEHTKLEGHLDEGLDLDDLYKGGISRLMS